MTYPVEVVAQSASRTLDVLNKRSPALLGPFVAIVAVAALVIAVAAFLRARRVSE